ncbi:thioesterase II family protein [Streptomyces clavuligerus]|nr:alpha/beta fold hydrolase [Streptomyces clavuligerus]ANW21322.1 oxidoreductase [Streptomyces clavuligerus]WDN50775.1 alpha/beta fold hydrolase [Streptomyces clavuligerus]
MTRYLRRGGPAADGDRLRIFCFPYAGGGASAYAGWQRRLGPTVDVQPVQLPGREGRMADPRFTDLRALVADLDEQLGPALDGPHVLYGHSMGALVAFALTQRRHALGRPLPQALLLSAHRAPHLPPPVIISGRVENDDELVHGLATLGGLPAALLERPDWLAALLPVVRGDLKICASSGEVERLPVPVPIHTFAGVDDQLVTPREIREWGAYTTASSESRVLPGGHFFIREQEAVFLEHLAGVLRPYEDASGHRPPALVGAAD